MYLFKFHCKNPEMYKVQISLLLRPLHSNIVICMEKWLEKFGMAKNGLSKFFFKKDWYKFRIAKTGHSEFFPTIFPKKTGINSEWPKMATLNFF